MDNIFSLDGGIFDLAASDMGDLNSFPTMNGQGNNTAGSLAGSDSGLSMDHADLSVPIPDQSLLVCFKNPNKTFSTCLQ